MASKWPRLGPTLIEMPWSDTQRLQSYADRGDLVLETRSPVRPPDPDADAILAPLAAHVECGKGPDDPLLEARDVGPHIGPPPLQVEHHIGHPLAGPVIGDLPASSGGKHRQSRLEQAGGLAAGAGRIERRMFQQPDQFRRMARPRYRRPGLPSPRPPRDKLPEPPRSAIDSAAAGGAREGRQIKALAIINHWLTITW